MYQGLLPWNRYWILLSPTLQGTATLQILMDGGGKVYSSIAQEDMDGNPMRKLYHEFLCVNPRQKARTRPSNNGRRKVL